ncbi:hypothetical protein BJ878DRAFT_476209 [Calycina marina]|uniref:Uncharacterized protein n=1 Tax=Calycina marina TaxID=1763456 RepID=A0A9P7ZAR6_9HELO|nr:hypothetical protein BJ878DRAFT_476209 [Calycina marina]
MPASTKANLSPSLAKLSTSSSSSKNTPVENWEDASSSSETDEPKTASTPMQSSFPSAPPPTPISPSYSSSPFSHPSQDFPSISSATERGIRGGEKVRPDKTDAVAKRLIAGALGVKAPKRTEEQRAYDLALREKEVKRREKKKEDSLRAEEEKEKARRAVWED